MLDPVRPDGAPPPAGKATGLQCSDAGSMDARPSRASARGAFLSAGAYKLARAHTHTRPTAHTFYLQSSMRQFPFESPPFDSPLDGNEKRQMVRSERLHTHSGPKMLRPSESKAASFPKLEMCPSDSFCGRKKSRKLKRACIPQEQPPSRSHGRRSPQPQSPPTHCRRRRRRRRGRACPRAARGPGACAGPGARRLAGPRRCARRPRGARARGRSGGGPRPGLPPQPPGRGAAAATAGLQGGAAKRRESGRRHRRRGAGLGAGGAVRGDGIRWRPGPGDGAAGARRRGAAGWASSLGDSESRGRRRAGGRGCAVRARARCEHARLSGASTRGHGPTRLRGRPHAPPARDCSPPARTAALPC